MCIHWLFLASAAAEIKLCSAVGRFTELYVCVCACVCVVQVVSLNEGGSDHSRCLYTIITNTGCCQKLLASNCKLTITLTITLITCSYIERMVRHCLLLV